ncbi:PIN domain-containing protein [Frankia sp. CiP1_Cm_nod2]|uniref:PIN domain-containing protein n=1 Tax=Frankia sp. CiP1_Cm_nod2 TaxID=2897161 RepID=UPI002024281D
MLLVDTGVIVAAADRNDPHHTACAQLLERTDSPLVTSPLVIAEAAYLINRELGPTAELALYTAIIDDALTVETLTHTDWTRIRELAGRYRGLPLGGTDASVIALSERLGTDQVATLDHRHFRVVRPAHTSALTLLPWRCLPLSRRRREGRGSRPCWHHAVGRGAGVWLGPLSDPRPTLVAAAAVPTGNLLS